MKTKPEGGKGKQSPRSVHVDENAGEERYEPHGK